MKGIANDYLAVMPDGTVRLTSGKVDIGQGITTALVQIAAAELEVAATRVRIERTDTASSPDEGYTAGSRSVEQGGSAVREAAAALKSQLLEMATHQIDTRLENLAVSDGRISGPSGRFTSYWELAGGEIETTPEGGDRGDGDGRRWDLPKKFLGEPSFVQDLELPGMLHGRVVRPPGPNVTLSSLDPAAAEALRGVESVVVSGSFVGVVAEREEHALRGARRLALDAQWSEPASGPDPSDPRYLLTEDADIEVALDTSDPSITVGSRSLHAEYTRPYLAHGSIGPSCAVAQQDGSELTIWCSSQGVFQLRAELCTALGLSTDDVRIIHLEGAGCYGHNGADDVALDAALLARAVPGRPVRVQWSRADEFAWEPYGSPMVIHLDASVDDDGMIDSWSHEVWSHGHSARPGGVIGVGLLAAHHMEDPHPMPGRKEPPLPAGGLVRNSVPLYDIPNAKSIGHFVKQSPVRTSALRGLGAHANVFAIESFMDELAALAGEDPVQFRLKHLSDERAKIVIRDVVEKAGVPIGQTDAQGHGFGLGFAQYKNLASYVAVVAEVEAEQSVRLVRAWASVDAGRIVSPDGAINQIEGGMIQSASWALMEAVRFEGNRSATRGWLDYPILSFSEVPEIAVHLIDSHDHPSVGVGEGPTGPMTAAIGNALAAALGTRIRDMPFTTERITAALLA